MSSLISNGWVVTHVGSQVTIEISRVLKADKHQRVIAGEHVHTISIREVDWRLPIHAKYGLVRGMHDDA
jgi:hypothetical protein